MRGLGGELIIAEEFAAMNPNVWRLAILPVLVTGAVFIGITTLGTENNFVSQIAMARNQENRLIFRLIKVELACESCRLRGRGADCTHLEGLLPYWHDNRKHGDVQALAGREGGDDYQRETRGMQSNSLERPAFDALALDLLLRDDHRIESGRADVTHVFVCVDPSGGSARSKCALVSGYFCGERDQLCVLTGAESALNCGPQQYGALVVDHIEAVRARVPRCARAIFVFVAESNLAFVGAMIASSMLNTVAARHARDPRYDAPRICVVNSQQNGNVGLRTDNQMKVQGAMAMDIRLRERLLRVHRHFQCVGLSPEDEDATGARTCKQPDEMLGDLVAQMRTFRRVVTEAQARNSNDLSRQNTVTYHGKSGGNYDDHVIAVIILACVAHPYFWANANTLYRDFRAP